MRLADKIVFMLSQTLIAYALDVLGIDTLNRIQHWPLLRLRPARRAYSSIHAQLDVVDNLAEALHLVGNEGGKRGRRAIGGLGPLFRQLRPHRRLVENAGR